jgi:Family of unknown function (DUF6328)
VADPEQAQERVKRQEEEEGLKVRLEREHGELLEELRALIPGAEVLFGFLLAIRFTGQFGDLSDAQRYVYYVTLLATAAALVFFLAPSAYHRIRFRAGDKEYMVSKGNREAIAGSAAISVAFTGVVYLVTELVFGTGQAIVVAVAFFALIVWRWWAVAVYRAWRDRRDRAVRL